MPKQTARHKSRLLRNAYGSTAAEAFMIVTILTILEGVPSSVELRRRPVVDQAALTSSS